MTLKLCALTTYLVGLISACYGLHDLTIVCSAGCIMLSIWGID